ncbi:hypothetical protein [Streptomyces sp. NPDC094468]|uniref:beta barrel domain-containing protein n=1 Tax=Streptomyces sp. NPDC094468 TaxID=3366066 RepID=UPI00380DC1B4
MTNNAGLPTLGRGDPLVLVEYQKDDRVVYVARVGRDYIYVTATLDGPKMPTRFRRDNGAENSPVGWKGVLYTLAQHEESNARAALLDELSRCGVEIAPAFLADMATATLRALRRVVRPVTGPAS